MLFFRRCSLVLILRCGQYTKLVLRKSVKAQGSPLVGGPKVLDRGPCIVLYRIVLSVMVLYCPFMTLSTYCIVHQQSCFVLCCPVIVLNCVVLYCNLLNCTFMVLCCICLFSICCIGHLLYCQFVVSYCVVLHLLYRLSIVWFCIVLYCIVLQYSVV